MRLLTTTLLFVVIATCEANRSSLGALVQAFDDQGASSNVTCILTFCSDELTACMTDFDCVRSTLCVLPCGTDQACVMQCMVDFGNDPLTDFLACSSSDHPCVVMPPQDPPYQCTPPLGSDSTFDYTAMKGDWNVLLGGNPTYDCFPCQVTTFGQLLSDGSFDAVMNYQATTSKGRPKKMQQISHMTPDSTNPAKLHLTANSYGNVLEDDWIIIDHEPDKYMLVYYCGEIPTGDGVNFWFYEGGVLYSKATTLDQLDYDKINQAATNAGVNLKGWCPVDQTNCLP